MENSRKFLRYFFKFLNFEPKFLKKMSGTFFEIIGVFDQVKGGEHENGQKTGTGSTFCRHFGEKPKM